MSARLFVAAVAVLSAFALTSPACASPAAATAYESGLAAYDACHWSEAASHFERAAAAGHVRSQEILGMMLFAGPSLYGDGIRRDPAAARRWFDLAEASGSEIGALMVKRMPAAQHARADVRD